MGFPAQQATPGKGQATHSTSPSTVKKSAAPPSGKSSTNGATHDKSSRQDSKQSLGLTASKAGKPVSNILSKPGKEKPGSQAKDKKGPPSSKLSANQRNDRIEDEKAAALYIQRCARGYIARRAYNSLQDKKAMQEEMQRLAQKAWEAQVVYERNQAEKVRKKEDEEKKRRVAETRARQGLLEAAYEGREQDLLQLLESSHLPVDTEDTNHNTLISEAANGGQASMVTLLIKQGADPNIPGEFGRTPLWRACFLGHLEAARALLEGGADPRISCDGGEKPLDVTNSQEVKNMLAGWDVTVTDKLRAKIEEGRAARAAQAAAEKLETAGRLETDLAEATKAHEAAQHQLSQAHAELEMRINEHDTCVAEDRPSVGVQENLIVVTLDQVKAAEEVLARATAVAAAAAEALADARIRLREHREEEMKQDFGESIGTMVSVSELEEAFMRDAGGKIAADGRWPLLIDTTLQCSVFLRYQDTNYVNICNPSNVEKERLRRSIIGSIRYGKPLVLDLMEVDMYDELVNRFNAIEEGLFSKLMNKSLLVNDAYLSLRKDSDGEQYAPNMFQVARVQAFKVVLLTTTRLPDERLLQQTYVMRVMSSEAADAVRKASLRPV